MKLAFRPDQIKFPATLTKTEQDRVDADNDMLAARVTSPLASAFVAPSVQL
jgi:hypothetical protein